MWATCLSLQSLDRCSGLLTHEVRAPILPREVKAHAAGVPADERLRRSGAAGAGSPRGCAPPQGGRRGWHALQQHQLSRLQALHGIVRKNFWSQTVWASHTCNDFQETPRSATAVEAAHHTAASSSFKCRSCTKVPSQLTWAPCTAQQLPTVSCTMSQSVSARLAHVMQA